MFNFEQAEQGANVVDEQGNQVIIKRMDLKGEYPILAITVIDGSMKRSERYSVNGVGRDGSQLMTIEDSQ